MDRIEVAAKALYEVYARYAPANGPWETLDPAGKALAKSMAVAAMLSSDPPTPVVIGAAEMHEDGTLTRNETCAPQNTPFHEHVVMKKPD